MKKIFFIVIVLITFSSNAFSQVFNWHKYDITANNDTEIYYDEKTIFQVGSYKFYWVLTNFLKNVEGDNFSSIGHHMANCKTNEVKMITFTFFDGLMGKGNVNYDFIDPEEYPEKFKWEHYDPKTTIYGGMLEEICNFK